MQAFEILEKEWGEFIGNPNTVACSSGTSALHLALETLELPAGSEVIVPDFTMIACARAVTMAGLKPLFVDCRKKDLLMTILTVNNGFTASTREDWGPWWHCWTHAIDAVMAVHIYGRQCNMDHIHGTARKHGCKVIEDMAEIHGVKPHPDTDAACWSFYKNKIIAGEEGGMISFKNPEHVARAKQLRSLGFTDAHDFYHIPRGINSRMSNLHAEPILRSLKNWPTNTTERRHIEGWYNFYTPEEWQMPKRDVVWVYDLRLPELDIVGPVVKELNEKDIAARQSFKPMSRQPEYGGSLKQMYLDAPILTEAYRASREIIYLPVYPGLSEERVRDNVSALREAVIHHTPVASTG